MSEYTTRRVSPQRQRTNLVARIAFTGFAAFGLLLIVVEVLVEDVHPTGAGRAFEIVTGGSAMVAFGFGVLCAAVGAILFPSSEYWSPRDNPLPAWGWWARVASRIGIRLFWVPLGVGLLTVVPAAIEHYVDVVPDNWRGDLLGGVLTTISLFGILLAVISRLVWLAFEVVAGFRERRGTRSSGEAA